MRSKNADNSDSSQPKERRRLLTSTNAEKISTIYPPNSIEFYNKLNELIRFPNDARNYLDAPGHLVQFRRYMLKDRMYTGHFVTKASYKAKTFRQYCVFHDWKFEDTLLNRAYLYYFMINEEVRVSFFKGLKLIRDYNLEVKDLETLSKLSYEKLKIHIGDLTPKLIKDIVKAEKPVKDLLHDPYFHELNRDPKDSNAYYSESWPYLISWEAYEKPKKKGLR